MFKATLDSRTGEVAWEPPNKSDALAEIREAKEQKHFPFLVVVEGVNFFNSP
jgi:hypothetical protein